MNIFDQINSSKVIGILGGMGPYATVMFMQNILDLTNAKKDWDHIRTVVDNNTQIPSRSRAILFNETSPYDAMLESSRKLESYPVDAIVVPCNSAIYWIKEIEESLSIPIFNIVEVASKAIRNIHNPEKVAVLTGAVSYQTDLYKTSVENEGMEYIKLPNNIQSKVEGLIESIKLMGGNENLQLQQELSSVIDEIIKLTSVEIIILGCTEFTYFKNYNYSVPVVDSSHELALKTIKFAKGI
jgi:aspartate racemase